MIGTIDLVDIEGNVLETVANIKLCGCGLTKEKPICDGAHKLRKSESK
jgi:2-oxopent-4-enoate/cis-2-oxohex-4-enoate hydratase